MCRFETRVFALVTPKWAVRLALILLPEAEGLESLVVFVAAVGSSFAVR